MSHLELQRQGNLSCAYNHIPDASALAVSHNRMATKSFGMRFDLLANLLPPGITSLWLIWKTQNSESNSFQKILDSNSTV